jgi:hypothetical protein
VYQPPLRYEVSKYQVLKERLLENCSTIDEETLGNTLEGITDPHEMIAAVIRSALVDEALQAGLRSRLEEMRQRRLARLEERGTKKRQLALDAMCERRWWHEREIDPLAIAQQLWAQSHSAVATSSRAE